MKVLLINGSPNAGGCTYTALKEVESELSKAGIETEIIQVGHLDIRGCIACRRCATLGKCVFDDIVNEVAAKFEACDGIVLGTPVYYASINGTLKAFADRLFYSAHFDKTMKVGAAVVSCRRGGASSAFDVLNKYFTIIRNAGCFQPVLEQRTRQHTRGSKAGPGRLASDAGPGQKHGVPY